MFATPPCLAKKSTSGFHLGYTRRTNFLLEILGGKAMKYNTSSIDAGKELFDGDLPTMAPIHCIKEYTEFPCVRQWLICSLKNPGT